MSREPEPMSDAPPARLHVIDGIAFFYRAFYGSKRALTRSDGFPTNAIYLFTRALGKLLETKNPEAILVALDSKEKTFRHEIYPDYKANRDKPPEALIAQLPYIDPILDAFNIQSARAPGFEADDIIATIARAAKESAIECVIVSSDKDLAQLIDSSVTIFDPIKEISIDQGAARAKYGVDPEKMVDMMALMGDSADNIKGAPGIGPKRAADLIARFGDLDNLLASFDQIENQKIRAAIEENVEQIRLARKLVALDSNAPIEIDFERWRRKEPDKKKLIALSEKFEFRSLIDELASQTKIAPDGDYQLLSDIDSLRGLIAKARARGQIALDVETDSTDPLRANLIGIALSSEEKSASYIPVRHFNAQGQISIEEIRSELGALLTDESIRKIGHNLKYDLAVLENEGIGARSKFFDTMIVSALLDSSRARGLKELARSLLSIEQTSYKSVVSRAGAKIPFAEVDPETAASYAGADVDLTLRLANLFEPELNADRALSALYHEIESELIPILGAMERHGARIDLVRLGALGEEIDARVKLSRAKIHSQADEEFNINSPKQLGEILFNKLKLPPSRKKKTGFSTDHETLTKLIGRHSIISDILEYRELTKLKGTYVDALARAVDENGRVHTSFQQIGAQTGRLSSSDPNLQNIPVKTEMGRAIRALFIAEEGSTLLSADYSQIELRLLASFSGDENMIATFNDGGDIHLQTAARIYDSPPELLPPEARRAAKAINFGLIYGQSAFGLSRALKIDQRRAKKFIDDYFAAYPGAKRFFAEHIARTRKEGKVITLLGRIRPAHGIDSSNQTTRSAAERAAINTLMQGSAADIIKVAMVKVTRAMSQAGLRSRLILQVHDELLLEAKFEEIDRLAKIVKREMETAVELSVELTVDLKVGRSWAKMERIDGK